MICRIVMLVEQCKFYYIICKFFLLFINELRKKFNFFCNFFACKFASIKIMYYICNTELNEILI